jgi:hypothetical protein
VFSPDGRMSLGKIVAVSYILLEAVKNIQVATKVILNLHKYEQH